MTETPNEQPAAGPDGADWIDPEELGAPWLDLGIQQQIQWRDGDVVISVPVKSGTTWTMNIVHQLRAGGDPDLEDVYVEVPWLELLGGPSTRPEDVVGRIDSMPRATRRAFKTHSAPGMLPYFAPGTGPDVRYVVVVRNPDEVLASMYPFVKSHSVGWFDLWGIDKDEFVPPDIDAFFEGFAKQMLPGALYGFTAAWWPYRNASNVLMLHFAEMKQDHEGSVRRIADFLGFEPSASEWKTILECTSFPWMKAHESKFEAQTVADVPILDKGAMVRKGKLGSAREDGVTAQMSAALKALGSEMLTDTDAMRWLYEGRAPG